MLGADVQTCLHILYSNIEAVMKNMSNQLVEKIRECSIF